MLYNFELVNYYSSRHDQASSWFNIGKSMQKNTSLIYTLLMGYKQQVNFIAYTLINCNETSLI